MQRMRRHSLTQYIKSAYQKGQIAVTNERLAKDLKLSKPLLNAHLNRLKRKHELFSPVKGFHVIVPIEFQDRGFVSPDRFIHELMNFLKKPYYIGLLSAARYHGVSSQVSQVFQVITDLRRPEIKKNGLRILFLSSKHISHAKVERIKTDTGFIYVSSRAQTMIDLIRFHAQSGGVNHVASLVRDLAEEMKPSDLATIIKHEPELAQLRRLGYLLETYSKSNALVKVIRSELSKRAKTKSCTLLVPGIHIRNATKNNKWCLWINYKLEVE